MTYIFDTSSFIVLGHYFPTRFPTFWERFNERVIQGDIISVREVFRELNKEAAKPHLLEWANNNKMLFRLPEPKETEFVRKIFSNAHFQALVRRKQVLRGSPVADPFVIASAYAIQGCVVTEETKRPHAAKIPNICDHYGIECTNLEGLMERESWSF